MAIASKFLPRVKKKVIAVEKLLEGSVAAEKKKIDDAKREASEERKAKSEEQLEKKEEKGDKLPFKQQRKKVGDFLSNFITNMLLGAAVMKLLDFVNSEHFQSFIDGVKATVAFIENVGGMLLGGLISFIDWAYGLYDGLRGFVYDNFGEEGLKKFDTFMKNFGTFLNAALIGIMALLKFKFLRTGLKNIGKFFGKIFRRGILKAFKRFSLKFLGKGVTKFLGKGLSAAKGLLSKGVSAIGKGVGGLAAKIFGKSAGVIAPALKGAMGAVKGFFSRIPILGPLVVAIVSLLSGEPPAQAAFKGIGAALGGALGTFIPIPILGTLLGEAIGSFVGDLLYYGIIEGDWKKAGKVFGQTLKAILSAGGKVLEYIGGVGKRFIDDFPMVDVPDFKLGSLIGDMLAKQPVIGDMINFELKLPEGPFGAIHKAVDALPGIPDEWKTALKEGFSIKGILDGLPGLREVLGAFAQFIPGLNKHVKNGALMKIPNLLLLTPIGAPFLIPHVGKSLFPGLFDGKASEARTDVPAPPDSGGGLMGFLTGGTSTDGGEQQQPGYSGSGLGSGGARMGEFDVEASNDIVKVGKDLISQGFSVAEHPDFTKTPTATGGTYTPGKGTVSNVHSGRGHYEGRAIDVTDWRGSLEDSKARYRSVLDSIYNNGNMAKDMLLIHDSWGAADKSGKDGPGSHAHPTHMHIEVKDRGGLVGKGLFANLGKPEFVIDSDSLIPETMDMFRAITHAKDKKGVLAAIRDYAPYDSIEPEQVLVPVGGASGGTPAPQSPGGVIKQFVGGAEDPFERLYMGG